MAGGGVAFQEGDGRDRRGTESGFVSIPGGELLSSVRDADGAEVFAFRFPSKRTHEEEEEIRESPRRVFRIGTGKPFLASVHRDSEHPRAGRTRTQFRTMPNARLAKETSEGENKKRAENESAPSHPLVPGEQREERARFSRRPPGPRHTATAHA